MVWNQERKWRYLLLIEGPPSPWHRRGKGKNGWRHKDYRFGGRQISLQLCFLIKKTKYKVRSSAERWHVEIGVWGCYNLVCMKWLLVLYWSFCTSGHLSKQQVKHPLWVIFVLPHILQPSPSSKCSLHTFYVSFVETWWGSCLKSVITVS